MCLFPVSKSFGSWAGVTLTTPVPNVISTKILSKIIGILIFLTGWYTDFPWYYLYLSSSGWIAKAASPNIVSGRVVAKVNLSLNYVGSYSNIF